MIQQPNEISATPPTVAINDSSRIGKRRLSFVGSCDDSEAMIITKQRKLDALSIDDTFEALDIESSHSKVVSFPHESMPTSEQEEIFEWMESVINGAVSENATGMPEAASSSTTTQMENNVSEFNSSGKDTEFDSFLVMNKSDPCYEEMISLLADDGKIVVDDHNKEENDNIFKNLRESFASDRLPKDISLRTEQLASTKKNSKATRSSRISIREGLEQLVNASRLSAKTRTMLLACTINLCKVKDQQ